MMQSMEGRTSNKCDSGIACWMWPGAHRGGMVETGSSQRHGDARTDGGRAGSGGESLLANLVRGVGLLLFVIGVVKIHGLLAAKDAMRAWLDLGNPVLVFLPNRSVLVLGAVLEIVVGWRTFRGRNLLASAVLLGWLSAALILYKIALGVVDYHGPCGCLFGLSSIVPLPVDVQRTVADSIVLGAFFLSLLVVIRGRRRWRAADGRR